MRKISNLISIFLVFITLSIFSLSFLLTNPISSKSLIESISEFYGYKIELSFSALHWNPITPNLEFSKIHLKSTNSSEPLSITLEEVNVQLNLLTLFTLKPISSFSANDGRVLLKEMPAPFKATSLQENTFLSNLMYYILHLNKCSKMS